MAEEPTKKKILLVEDDSFIVDLLATELTNSGFEVTVGTSGREGVEKFKEKKPDLVVLDLLLPDQNGLDVLRQIRRDPEGEHVKAIVLSNVSEVVQSGEAQRLGVTEYLVKVNYSISEIIDKIKNVFKS